MKKLVFVCTINRHRSVIAEFLFKHILNGKNLDFLQKIDISSAGIVTKQQKLDNKKEGVSIPKPLFGYRPMPCVILYMHKAGIDVSEYRSKALNAKMAKEVNLIIAMGEGHKKSVLNIYPVAKGKVFTLAELSHPFQFDNIVVKEPAGLMPTNKFCMLRCNHWSITETIIEEIKERLEEASTKIISHLGF